MIEILLYPIGILSRTLNSCRIYECIFGRDFVIHLIDWQSNSHAMYDGCKVRVAPRLYDPDFLYDDPTHAALRLGMPSFDYETNEIFGEA
jgi:hypothetical protein